MTAKRPVPAEDRADILPAINMVAPRTAATLHPDSRDSRSRATPNDNTDPDIPLNIAAHFQGNTPVDARYDRATMSDDAGDAHGPRHRRDGCGARTDGPP